MMECDASLRQQFQTLQDQQQQRLQQRLKRKEERQLTAKSGEGRQSSGKSTASATSLSSQNAQNFGVSDDLKLKMVPPVLPDASCVSLELVDHLNAQIREARDENGRLYKLLSEKDFEMKQLRKKKSDEKTAIMESQLTNETAATRIVELSKKIRELTAEMESEKTRSKQLQRTCQELQAQASNVERGREGQSARCSQLGSVGALQPGAESKEDWEAEVKALQDKLRQTEFKMADYRNQCQVLKQEVKVAHKVLGQELGESVNVQALLNNATNFRGRAQTILALQNKVEELKSQVLSLQTGDGEGEGEGEGGGQTGRRRRGQEDKQRQELRRLEKERKDAAERATAERKALEEENHILKQKMEAARARNKALSREMKDVKDHMQVLLRKGHNDDELISALTAQQRQLRELVQGATSQRTEEQEGREASQRQQQLEEQHHLNSIAQLKAIVADREHKIHALEAHLSHLTQDGGGSPVCSESNTPHDTPPPVQAPRPPFTPSASAPHSRQDCAIPDSHTPAAAAHPSLPPQAGAVESVSEHGPELEEARSLLQAVQVERDRLTELTALLQTRLSAEVERVSDVQSELMSARRQLVVLEKEVGRQALHRAGGKRGVTSSAARDSQAGEGESAQPVSASQLQELNGMLEILRDEVEAQKAALQRTLLAKEEDLQLYSRAMGETKQVFLQALRQIKQSHTPS